MKVTITGMPEIPAQTQHDVGREFLMVLYEFHYMADGVKVEFGNEE